MKNTHYEVIIIGAGAAGLMCAIEAGKRGRKVLVLDHANKPGKKILMSGGGRCNFTNLYTSPDNFISHNPHFCKSALSRYTQWNFIELVNRYKIPYHEKTLGQLFCDNKAKDIVNLLLAENNKNNSEIKLNTKIINIIKNQNNLFNLKTSIGDLSCESLVIATGGLSIPTMGASPFGYQIAEQFDLKVYPTRAALVPFTLQPIDKNKYGELSGISFNSIVQSHKISFQENSLFTHRGLSGPAMLQISSYWQPGENISIDLLPEIDFPKAISRALPNILLKSFLSSYFPKRMVSVFLDTGLLNTPIKNLSNKQINYCENILKNWQIKPNGTEGYRTAEVTLGGVDTNQLSSKTMETKKIPNLYFIGEVVDVTGWLGGYNFQWAWSSAWAAGQVV